MPMRPILLPARTPGAAVRRRALVAALGLAVVGSACGGCGDTGFQTSGGRLKVEWDTLPEPLRVPPGVVTIEGIPGRVSAVSLKVTNDGNSNLVFKGEPVFLNVADGQPAGDFRLTERFLVGCDETEFPAERRATFFPGNCAWLRFEYAPTADGPDDTILRFTTDDDSLEGGLLDVSIVASAATPDLEVWAFDAAGTSLGFSAPGSLPGSPFEVEFGEAEVGAAIPRRLELRSKGSRPLAIDGVKLTGDADFTVTPDDVRAVLAPGEKSELQVTFTALSGGPREARLLIDSNDPAEGKLEVRLLARGDGPALCTAVARPPEQTCDTRTLRPAIKADFGDVGLGTPAELTLCLVSCGSRPLEVQSVAIEGSPPFGAASSGFPRTLAVGERAELPLTFAPATPDTFTGRIGIGLASGPVSIGLEGRGVVSGCKLESGAGVFDFGQVAVSVTARRRYAVSNTGTEDCVVDEAPEITVGADARFLVTGFPPTAVIAPGTNVAFELGYNPAAADGVIDTGEVTIRYHADTPNPAQASLVVQLKGTPTATPICTIVANPGGNSQFGRTLNFGQVRLNQEKVLSVTFQNTGSSQCTVSPGSISGPSLPLPGFPNDLPAFSVKLQPRLHLQPGEVTEAQIAFKPTEDRAYGSALPGFPGIPGLPGGNAFGVKFTSRTSDDVSHDGQSCAGFGGGAVPGCIGWDLSGEGAKSDLHVLPSDLDFGLVTLGCRSQERIVTLYNVGAAPLEIKSIKVDPVVTPEVFRVTGLPPAGTSIILAGGGQKQIAVRYRPPDTAIHTANLLIESDATNTAAGNPFVTVSLRGEGTTESSVTDTFDQNSRPKSDVLFVIDDSGSMSEEQNALGNNASRFIQTATSLNTDFQIGVATTDMSAGDRKGRLIGSPKIIRPGANAASQFASTVRGVGANGSADERGLEAMFAALTDPLINDPAANQGFLRPDAKLAVVVVSDEDDFSSGTTVFYADFLRNLKGVHNASLVTFSAIVGEEPNGCSSSNGDASAGGRYIDVQTRTSGRFRSICSADWGQIAADLGLDAFGARSGFQLSRDADASQPMTVTVNGAVAPGPPANPAAWSYDPGTNTVVFSPQPPPAGATVVITYEAACF